MKRPTPRILAVSKHDEDMRILLLTALLTSFQVCKSQNQIDYSQEFAEKSLNRDFLVADTSFEELLKKANLSDSWNMTKGFGGKDRKEYNIYSHQGIFGNNYTRIDFFVDEVSKSPENPLLYLVKGKSRLKENICDFEGKIEITNIKRFKKTGESVIHSYEFSDTVYNGVIVADYTFYENKDQYGSGVFRGTFSSGVFIYPNHLNFSQIGSWDEIDETNMYGTFVGIWESYKTSSAKLCIWNYYTDNYPYSGDFHAIPNSEMEARKQEIQKIETPLTADQLFGNGINPKYRKNGWELPSDQYNKGWWK